MSTTYSLPQAERINSKKQIDRIFKGGGSKAMTASPLRMVYMTDERLKDARGPMAQMMVSVPKRFFKRAVKRNLIKRQVREAYRLNKHIINDTLKRTADRDVSMCFIWTSNSLCTTADVAAHMRNLLQRLAERIERGSAKKDTEEPE